MLSALVEKGTLTIPRALLDQDFWYDVQSFRLYLWCYSRASRSPWTTKNKIFTMQVGQLLTSFSKLRSFLGYDKGNARNDATSDVVSRSINKLRKLELIEVHEKERGVMIIEILHYATLINYKSYQPGGITRVLRQEEKPMCGPVKNLVTTLIRETGNENNF